MAVLTQFEPTATTPAMPTVWAFRDSEFRSWKEGYAPRYPEKQKCAERRIGMSIGAGHIFSCQGA
jgi:hypothetical protein